jgi:EmrB/QacA subfamily drug resistance transporter
MRIQRFSSAGTLAVVCLATAMLMLDIAVVNTALPQIALDLRSNLTGIQWIVDAYTLALAAVVLTAGSIADRVGRRLIFTSGIGLFTATSLACALASDIAVLDAARALQGIGAAMMFASSLAILVDAFPTDPGRAKAFAAYGATIGASFAVGPLVGGALTSAISWRAVFYVNVPLGIAALLASYASLRESRDPSPRAIDRIGQTTLTGGLFLLVLALLRANQEGWGSPRIVAELVGAAIFLALFVVTESRVEQPMLPLRLFRRPDFSGAQIAAFAISASHVHERPALRVERAGVGALVVFARLVIDGEQTRHFDQLHRAVEQPEPAHRHAPHAHPAAWRRLERRKEFRQTLTQPQREFIAGLTNGEMRVLVDDDRIGRRVE